MPARLRNRIAVCVAVGVAGVLAVGPGSANASQVSCGQTIKSDTKLSNDLVDCPDNGIIIGRDGITLDLNGHTVDGNDELVEKCPRRQICDAGILNDAHAGVTVRGGSVQQFGLGIFVIDAKHARVDRIHSSANQFNGVLFVASTRSQLVNSTVVRNGLETDFPGIAVVAGSTRLRIAGNKSAGNADLGLWLVDGSSRNRIVGNDFRNNPEAGMIVEGNGNEIVRNHVSQNGDGIILSGTGNAVVGNMIARSRGFGACACGNGISLEDGHHNLITRNRIRGATATGIRLKTFAGPQNLTDNRVRHNSVRDVAGRGILVGAKVQDTLLTRNHVRRSDGNGIGVNSAATTLTRNHANRNRAHGIVAVAGVVDGGGNEAAANGKSPQCVNVACG